MRYGICNETFAGWDHDRVCKFVAEVGYTGLELAPFTLAPLITDVPAKRRQELRKQAEDCGLQIFGLHWLLAKTEGLQLTSPEAPVRKRTADYLVELARFCRDVGGELMVFGSPAQRRIPEGKTKAQAMDYAAETFQQALPAIADCGIKVCLEPLTAAETDFLITCAEGVALLDKVKHPNFVLHQDVKAMTSDELPVPDLIRRYASRTGHFHANDSNLRGPGFGKVDFVPIFQALLATGYKGWVSVEVFDYTPDPETIARDSLRYMKECEVKAAAGVSRQSACL